MPQFELPKQLWIVVGKFPNGDFTYKVAETIETAYHLMAENNANAVLVEACKYVPEV